MELNIKDDISVQKMNYKKNQSSIYKAAGKLSKLIIIPLCSSPTGGCSSPQTVDFFSLHTSGCLSPTVGCSSPTEGC